MRKVAHSGLEMRETSVRNLESIETSKKEIWWRFLEIKMLFRKVKNLHLILGYLFIPNTKTNTKTIVPGHFWHDPT